LVPTLEEEEEQEGRKKRRRRRRREIKLGGVMGGGCCRVSLGRHCVFDDAVAQSLSTFAFAHFSILRRKISKYKSNKDYGYYYPGYIYGHDHHPCSLNHPGPAL
jgi:hypothetical protein